MIVDKNFWNQRYGSKDYAYGIAPNVWLEQKLAGIKTGAVLIPADGEGRNGVFAAQQGWNVTSFDMSESAKEKALLLAKEKGVDLNYEIADMEDVAFPDDTFDALVLVYAHFPESKRKEWHRRLSRMIKPGGYLILEAFHKLHQQFQLVNPTAGGPKDTSMLYDGEMMKNDFPGWNMIDLREEEIMLSEGPYHKGQANVVRVFAQKSGT